MDFALLSFVVFLATALYIRYTKYVYKIFSGPLEEWNYCYACLSFWIALSFSLLLVLLKSDFILMEILNENANILLIVSIISFLYNYETSKLFEKIRMMQFGLFVPVFAAIFLFFWYIFSISFFNYGLIFLFALSSSLMSVLLKLFIFDYLIDRGKA